MAEYSYEIGTTSSTTNLESLTAPVNPPRSEFVPWSRTYDRADGVVASDGYPVARWHFDVISATQIAQLKTSSGVSGKSGACYVKTRTDTNAFTKYSCILIWPDDISAKRVFRDRYLDVTIEFRKLVAV
jgi:hypothetical protein